MKKIIVSTTVILCLATSSICQQTNFGFRAGLNFATWKMGDILPGYSTKFKTGPEAGFYASIPVADRFSIQPEILYSSHGTRYLFQNEKAFYRSNYFVLPVMAKYKIKDEFAVVGGPQLGFLVSARSEINNVKSDYKEAMKGITAFGVAGAEYVFPFGLSLSLRYNHGIGSSEKDAETTLKNRSFSFGVGYPLLQKRK